MKLGAYKIGGVAVSESEIYDLADLSGNAPFKVANILTSDYEDISTIENFDRYGLELIGSAKGFRDWKCLQREIKALVLEKTNNEMGTNWEELNANEKLIACRYLLSKIPADKLNETIPDETARMDTAVFFDFKNREARGSWSGSTGRIQAVRAYLFGKIGPVNALEVFYDAVKDGLLELYEGGIEGTLEDGNLGVNDFILARGGTFYSTDGLKARNYPVTDGSEDSLADVANVLAGIISNGYY